MTIIYFFLAALALGVLILIHELGHFIAARSVGMVVESFSIGFGPAIFCKKMRGVIWRVGIVPFGGYVKILGMDNQKRGNDRNDIDPYLIKGGFFNKSPLKRIIVLAAGPFANILLGFLFFWGIGLLGGRTKNFSEFTQVVGWINSDSEFYKKGLRAGDVITSYDGKNYEGSKDLAYMAVMPKEKVNLKGFRPGIYNESGKESSFDYTVSSLISEKTRKGTPPFIGASYLIYEGASLPEGSPMRLSGIRPGDQIVWMDGAFIYSMETLSQLLNSNYSLLTVERNGKVFLTRQTRVLAGDLIIPPHLKNDLIDWQYESGIRGKWSALWMLPYNININGYVEGLLSLDSNELLEIGDKILAVDGVAVSNGYEILKSLQQHFVSIIVKRKVDFKSKTILEEDREFVRSFDFSKIKPIIDSLGISSSVKNSGDYVLLNPIHPRKWDQFDLSKESREKILRQQMIQQEEIAKIRNKNQRRKYLDLWELNQQKILLGLPLRDRDISYNPGTFVMLSNVFSESLRTLKALVTGNLNPKWLAGPVGIVQTLHYGWSLGFGEALFWMGLISINLSVLNLLPIPVLDGGYIVICLWELISRKKLNIKLLERILVPFMVLLILLFVFLTFQDLFRVFF